MANIYNRRQAFKDVKDFVMAGPVPTAPLKRVAMLTDYVNPDQRIVACRGRGLWGRIDCARYFTSRDPSA
jgi:hypothetical protein